MKHKEICDGLFVLEPKVHIDERGEFFESFKTDIYSEIGISDHFFQDNLSYSKFRVLRGLHFNVQNPQSQLVTLISGEIFDVVVDLRVGSDTFGRWFGLTLKKGGARQLYMAPGFAHGFVTLSSNACLHYKVNKPYDPSDEGGIIWDDPDLAIEWPVVSPIINQRDSSFKKLRDTNIESIPI